VYSNLKKSYNANASTSLRILENKAGDCTEHALLLVALARAVDMPAKRVSGVAYGEQEGENGFWGHAWTEIHDGNRWVTVDPMWNQTLVDATHLALLSASGNNASFKVKEVQTSADRNASNSSHLSAIGNLSISHVFSTKASLSMMYLTLSLEKPPKMKVQNEAARLGRLLKVNIAGLNKLNRLTPGDRKYIGGVVNLYKKLHVQSENLIKHSKEPTKETAATFEKTEKEIDKELNKLLGR